MGFIEQRILESLERAAKRGTVLNTASIALRVFPHDQSKSSLVATREGLKMLERRGLVCRLMQGEGQGHSIWTKPGTSIKSSSPTVEY
jgi:hypothetical protein